MDFKEVNGHYVRAPQGLTQPQVRLMLLAAKAKTPDEESQVYKYVCNISFIMKLPMRVLTRTGHLRIIADERTSGKKRLVLTKAGAAWLEYYKVWLTTPLPDSL